MILQAPQAFEAEVSKVVYNQREPSQYPSPLSPSARALPAPCGCRSTRKGTRAATLQRIPSALAEIQRILCNQSRPAKQPLTQPHRSKRGSGGKALFCFSPGGFAPLSTRESGYLLHLSLPAKRNAAYTKRSTIPVLLERYLNNDIISWGLRPLTWLSPGLISCSKRAFLRWPRATTCSSMEPWVTRRMTSTLRVWPMR